MTIETATIATPRFAKTPRIPDAMLKAQRRVLAGELTAEQANRKLGVRTEPRQPCPDQLERRTAALREARKRLDRYRALLEA